MFLPNFFSQMRLFWFRISFLVVVCLLAGGGVAALTALASPAAPGDLDLTFDGDGMVMTSVSGGLDEGQALVIQPDGKIVVAGSSERPSAPGTTYFTLLRYQPDGSLDATFAGDGVLTTAVGLDDAARAVALQADGKIVAAGISSAGAEPMFALVRTLADGSPDTGFGVNGILTVRVGLGGAEAYGVQIQPDGKIVAAGAGEISGTVSSFALIRTLTDGSLDASFGLSGVVTTAVSVGEDRLRTLVLQPDGRILAAGASSSGGANSTFALARYESDGSLDTGFGISGLLTVAIGTRDEGYDLALQEDGRFIMAGTTITSVPNFPSIFVISSALLRFELSGTLDAGFGTGGVVTNSFGTVQETGRAVIVQPDGKIVVAGTRVIDIGNASFALARYLPDGSPDTAFGTDGIVFTELVMNINNGRDLAIQPDAKLVMAGYTLNEDRTEGDFAVTRYENQLEVELTEFIYLPVVIRQP